MRTPLKNNRPKTPFDLVGRPPFSPFRNPDFNFHPVGRPDSELCLKLSKLFQEAFTVEKVNPVLDIVRHDSPCNFDINVTIASPLHYKGAVTSREQLDKYRTKLTVKMRTYDPPNTPAEHDPESIEWSQETTKVAAAYEDQTILIIINNKPDVTIDPEQCTEDEPVPSLRTKIEKQKGKNRALKESIREQEAVIEYLCQKCPAATEFRGSPGQVDTQLEETDYSLGRAAMRSMGIRLQWEREVGQNLEQRLRTCLRRKDGPFKQLMEHLSTQKDEEVKRLKEESNTLASLTAFIEKIRSLHASEKRYGKI